MSDIAIFGGNKVPAFVKKAELSAIAKALSGGAGQSGKRVSIKGGVFRLVHDGKEVAQIEDRHLDVVIVNAAPKVSRIFYAKKWDGDTSTAPDCWSSDGNVPDKNVTAPQGQNCADCEQNIKGSGNGDMKACRYQQRLAVVLASDVEGDVLQLSLPATSIFGKEVNGKYPLQAYARFLAAQSISPEMVVTEMRFDTSVESPKLVFKPKRWLTDDEYVTVQEKGQSPEAVKAVEFNVGTPAAPSALALEGKRPAKTKPVSELYEEEEAAAEEAPAPKPRAAAKKAAPKVEEAAEDEGEEPVVRKPAAKSSSVPAKTGLADIAAAWDDED
jgi:hypothetical protein